MARTTGKLRDRMKNNADVTRIVTYNCRKMAICCFLLLCIKVSWRHLANLKQMLRICALPALVGLLKKRAEWGERARLFYGGRQILGVHLCIFVISTGCPILNGPKAQNRQNSSRGSRFPLCIFLFRP